MFESKQQAGVHVLTEASLLGSFHFLSFGLRSRSGSLRRAAASSPVHSASEAPLRRREVDPDSRQRTLAASRRNFNDKEKPSRCKRSTVQWSSRLTPRADVTPATTPGRRWCGEQRVCVPSAVDEEKPGAADDVFLLPALLHPLSVKVRGINNRKDPDRLDFCSTKRKSQENSRWNFPPRIQENQGARTPRQVRFAN